jgi:hypothetical protein
MPRFAKLFLSMPGPGWLLLAKIESVIARPEVLIVIFTKTGDFVRVRRHLQIAIAFHETFGRSFDFTRQSRPSSCAKRFSSVLQRKRVSICPVLSKATQSRI